MLAVGVGTVRCSKNDPTDDNGAVLETGNGGNAFGFKFRFAGGSVRTKTSDSGAIIPNVNLNPSAGPQAGDFFYLDVV